MIIDLNTVIAGFPASKIKVMNSDGLQVGHVHRLDTCTGLYSGFEVCPEGEISEVPGYQISEGSWMPALKSCTKTYAWLEFICETEEQFARIDSLMTDSLFPYKCRLINE